MRLTCFVYICSSEGAQRTPLACVVSSHALQSSLSYRFCPWAVCKLLSAICPVLSTPVCVRVTLLLLEERAIHCKPFPVTWATRATPNPLLLTFRPCRSALSRRIQHHLPFHKSHNPFQSTSFSLIPVDGRHNIRHLFPTHATTVRRPTDLP